jgi:hypothetical protein
MTGSRTTPLKVLAAMGPMDVFLGSSPTPHARRSTRHIVGDEASMTTPTAIRTVKLANNDELGSSPPRFEKGEKANTRQPNSDVHVASSFEYRQTEPPNGTSFDEGTTIDEDALLAAVASNTEVYDCSDIVMSELPSSTIDLQLTAQLDADIQAHTAAVTHDTNEAAPDTSSTSRVDDSFSKPSSDKGTPQSQGLRRSVRHSATSSPIQSRSTKKRRSTPAKADTQVKKDMSEEIQPEQIPAAEQPIPQPDEEGMLDNIVVASPAKHQTSTKKRKSMSDAHHTQVVVPETNRKRGPVRRSQSLLSQVENSQDVMVEDTPAPKRARQSASQDVSDVKNTSQSSKRLSHVQVTPKRSSESGRASSEVARSENPTPAPKEPERIPTSQQLGTSTPSRSFTERVILTPRSIINQLKNLKDYLFSAPQFVLGRDEERELDDALFDLRRQVHAAGVRGEEKTKQHGDK